MSEQVAVLPRTPRIASQDRALAFRLHESGMSVLDIVHFFRTERDDENVTEKRIISDIKDVRMSDLVPDEGREMSEVAFLQSVIAKADAGWQKTGDIAFLNLSISLFDRVTDISRAE